MLSLVLPAVLAGLPVAYELDYRALPAQDTTPYYKYTIVISLEGQDDLKTECGVGRLAEPSDVADSFAGSLAADPLWKFKRNGDRVTIYSWDKSRVTKIAVTGNGPKPLVRRVLLAPPTPKK
jgi:hypothetical protein